MILDLLKQKKFRVALLGVISAVLVKIGMPETSVSELMAILSPLLAYIGAQGMVDFGKEKAQVVNNVAKEEKP